MARVCEAIQPSFAAPANLRSLVRDTGLYGLISIGVAMVIITGGIDLSIGSLIALSGVLLVQVVNVRIVDSDFESKIVETRAEIVEPAGLNVTALADHLDVTRQSMSAFLYRLAGGVTMMAAPPAPAFSDVTLSHPFFEEIQWMAEGGVSEGYADGTFRPSLPVSRAAMASFLQRVATEGYVGGI